MSSRKNMREIDTETPVIWPAWCYTGEPNALDESSRSISNDQLTNSGNTIISSGSSATSGKIKGKRKAIFQNPIDKMLSDRMMNIPENRKYCDNSNSSLLYDKNKCDLSMDYVKGDVEMTVNNNNIKTERLSPQNGDVLRSNSRSRSATPSSYPGTPPQSVNSTDNLHNSGVGTPIKCDFQPRNYSDFIRSLAAKYNNSNPNELSNSRSSFLEPNKFGLNSIKSTKESQSPPDNKRLPTSAQQVSNQNTIMSSIFPGIPFPTAVFSPLIDMSSTQALVTLARAAKEAELQNLLKNNNSTKKPNTDLTPPSSSNLSSNNISQNLATSSNNLLSSSSSRYSIQQPFNSSSSSSSTSLTQNPVRSPSTTTILPPSSTEQTTSPLDLSATPVTKRLKLESPSPSRSIESPVNQQRSTKVTSQRKCQSQCEEINSWNVDQVCDFVGSIDICAEYTENFREQRIDGTGLPLLTEDHLMNSLGMKLGPALKLKSVLAKKSGGPCPCVSCSLTLTAQSPAGSIPRPSSVDSGT